MCEDKYVCVSKLCVRISVCVRISCVCVSKLCVCVSKWCLRELCEGVVCE